MGGPPSSGASTPSSFARPGIGEQYVVIGWKIGGEGRKLWSGSAVFDEDGNPCAMGSATWIVLKTEQEDFKIAG